MSDGKKFTICVMADFGPGPYAWIRRPELSPPQVGTNIADAETGFQAKYNISEGLQKDFAAWVMEFNEDWECEDFPWSRWNEQGIALTRTLKRELRDCFLIEYHFPCEDPERGGEVLSID
jgi:hypothetical protein